MKHRPIRHLPEDSTVRVASVWALQTVLESRGTDLAGLLTEVGLDQTLFDNPDNLISFAARGRLLSHCVARTGCQHFGLLVGQQGGLHSLGLVGLLTKHSLDVGTALRSLVGYFHLHVHSAVTGLTVVGNTVMFTYAIHQPQVEAADQTGDGALAMMLNIMRSLCGAEWRPDEVWFAHRRPADARPFRKFFQAPLRFDAEQYALVFGAAWLEHRLPDADAELRRLLQKQIDALEVRHGSEFPEQVRGVLRAALLTGHASANEVAALFSMHTRTLSRRLRAFDVGFQELVDEGRFEFARQMLEDTSLDVSQIAASLDYADASAFTRAFRRWSGTTPALWRAGRARRT